MTIYIDRFRVYNVVENIVKWPFQNEDNFCSSALSTIVFVASQRLLNVSSIFSLILTTAVVYSIRRYQILKNTKVEEAKKKIKESKALETQKKE